MSRAAERRCGGRTLACVIESADGGTYHLLQGMSTLTRGFAEQCGLDTSRWPDDVVAVMGGAGADRRWVREDVYGEVHTFSLVDAGDFDILFAVSSRRLKNVPGELSGNLATNVLLELLDLPDPDDDDKRQYGTVLAYMAGRLWRNRVGGAFITDHCSEWDQRIVCSDLNADPVLDPAGWAAAISVVQSSEAANAVVVNGAAHKAAAHEAGICKWPRSTTTAIVSVHPETGAIDWDRNVCSAVRDALALKRAGRSWDECAAIVGARIPAYGLRDEPDRVPANIADSVRSRERRNAERRRAGRPEVPLRYLDDGSPNPAYRPETMLDLRHPGSSLRNMFLGGTGTPPRERATVLAQLHSRLDGMHPEDTTLELLSTGVFRRLQIDQAASNHSRKRYRYISYQLDPFEIDDDGTERFVIDADDVRWLKGLRTGNAGTGRAGTLPLIGLFTIDPNEMLWTSHGVLRAAGGDQVTLQRLDDGPIVHGRLSFSTGATRHGRVYRIWFVPAGGHRQRGGSFCVALVAASALQRTLIDAVCHVLERRPDLARMRIASGPVVDDQQVELRQAQASLKAAEDRLEATARSLGNPNLTPLLATRLVEQGAAIEAEVVALRDRLADAKRDAAISKHAEEVPLDHLVDLLAALELPLPLTPEVSSTVQRRLSHILLERRMRLVPETRELEVTAVLELRAESGRFLRIPLEGRVPNDAKDPWLGGAAGQFWGERCSFDTAFRSHAERTDPNRATRWRKPIIQRLLDENAGGLRWRGENAANLFVRCPYDAVVRVGFALMYGEDTSPFDPALVQEVRRVFFTNEGDLPGPKACNWTETPSKGRVTETIRRLVAVPTGTPYSSPPPQPTPPP